MKHSIIAGMAAVFFSAAAGAQTAPADLVAALSSKDAAVRSEAFENAAQAGPEAIVAVAPLLDHPEFEVARAAKLALEKIIGTASASEDTRIAAARALAVAVISVKKRDTLLWLLSYAGGAESMDALFGLLESAPQDFERTLMAIESLTQQRNEQGEVQLIEDSPAVQRLLDKLPTLPEAQQIAIINTFGAVRAAQAVPEITSYAAQGGNLGAAALEALGRIGARTAVVPLLDAWNQTADARVLDALLRATESLNPDDASKVYAALLAREAAANSAQAAAHCAALLGLGRTGEGARTVRAILPHLASPRADERGAARAALIALPGDEITRLVVRALRKAEPATKAALLETLWARDPQTARPHVEAALEKEVPEVQVAALGLLSETPQEADADRLLAFAQSGPDEGRVPALRGFLKLAAMQEDPAIALDRYHTALPLATRDEERITALEGLRVLADPSTLPHLHGIAGLSPKMEIPAGNVALAIAKTLESADAAAAQAVYRSLLDTPARKVAQEAVAGLGRLGIQEDFARAAGFLTRWQLIGPFAAESFSQKFPPEEQPFDPAAIYPGANAQQAAWRSHETRDPLGITDLDLIFSPNEDVVAYARTVFAVNQPTEAVLKVGSDDGVVIWLNGQQVHKNNAQRRVRVDEDIVPVALLPGENTLLLKIVQGGSDWGFTVRLVDPAGKPLPHL